MSPLDDQLRNALHGRADTLPPSPDPLAGIEARARGIRRRRVAAAVAGAALAVTAVAVVVPSLVTGSTGVKPGPLASPGPSSSSEGVLDPAHPWAFRGRTLPGAVLAAFVHDWQAKHAGSELTPLFGQIYEPAQRWEIAFVARDGASGDRYGYATQSDPGSVFDVDEALGAGTRSLAFALPGDELPRLLVVAAPDAQEIGYSGNGTQPWTPMNTVADGVAVHPLDGDQSKDSYQVVSAAGDATIQDAPNSDAGTALAGQPSNLLVWPTRGSDESTLVPEVKKQLAGSLLTTADQVELKVLFGGDTGSGVRYVLGQAWKRGAPTAYTFSYQTGAPADGPLLMLGAATPTNPQLLAMLVTGIPGATTDLLVVVPRIGAGQVSYDTDGAGAFTAVADGRSDLNGVGLIERSRTATDDRVEVLDGDGNLDRPLYRGHVQPLLCGAKECS